ncbi:MAG: SIS domain-containing protein [Planctomycetota bacterium]
MAGELADARDVLKQEAAALAALADRLDDRFERALDIIETCAASGGTLLVSGLGKSGLVGQKISATLASLGVPSHHVHPAEAVHGDLGRFRPSDAVICLSKSGETQEVVTLAAILKQDGLPSISITAGRGANDGDDAPPSSLERLCTVALTLGTRDEAGNAPAPTTSTTLTLALGDALALGVARRLGFTDADFAKRHPGGTLGGLLRPITEILRFRVGDNLRPVDDASTVAQALEASVVERRPGALLLVDGSGRLSGIFTDSDLRRLVTRSPDDLARTIAEVMTRSPRVLTETALVRDAVAMAREYRQDEIPVVDADGRPIGLVDVQDLIALKLVRG